MIDRSFIYVYIALFWTLKALTVMMGETLLHHQCVAPTWVMHGCHFWARTLTAPQLRCSEGEHCFCHLNRDDCVAGWKIQVGNLASTPGNPLLFCEECHGIFNDHSESGPRSPSHPKDGVSYKRPIRKRAWRPHFWCRCCRCLSAPPGAPRTRFGSSLRVSTAGGTPGPGCATRSEEGTFQGLHYRWNCTVHRWLISTNTNILLSAAQTVTPWDKHGRLFLRFAMARLPPTQEEAV